MPPHALESPAKRQSKWSAEEDALITELRGKGMKWDDISKRLPGRSAISCRLHYQNYLERRSEWDEERKNKLARLYERFKPEMWAKVAGEMHIPWRAAEAMHWQLGEAEMARRAGVVPFSLNTTTSHVSQGPRSQQHVSATRGHAHSQSQGSLPRDFAVGAPSTQYPRGPPRPPGYITPPPIGPTTPTLGRPLPSRRESLPARSPFSLPPPRQPPFQPPQQQQPQADYTYGYGPAPLQTTPTPYSHTTPSPTQGPASRRSTFLPSVAELTTGVNPFSPPAYTLGGGGPLPQVPHPPRLPPPGPQHHQHQPGGASPAQGSETAGGSGSGSGRGAGAGAEPASDSLLLALSAYQALGSAGPSTGTSTSTSSTSTSTTAPVVGAGAGGKRRASPAEMHDESKRRGAAGMGMYPRSSGAGVGDTPTTTSGGGRREGSSGSSSSSAGGMDPPVTGPPAMPVGTGGSSGKKGTRRGL